MPHDLRRATHMPEGGGYDLRRAAQTPPSGRSAFTMTRAKQDPGESGGLPLTKPARRAAASGRAMPTRGTKKGS